mgnify:FL=1
MSHTRIKICGIRDVNAARAAVDAGADAIGLVFVQASPRYVSLDAARAIVAALPPFIEPIGLFVDEPADHIRRACQSVGIHSVQLHGKESIDFARHLNDFRVIKAVSLEEDHHKTWLTHMRPRHVIGLLVDAPAPADAGKMTGGSGRSFDWSAVNSLDRASLPPLILAGGLTPENVGEAIRVARPYAVDVSSGVESSRGVKDVQMIRAFCDAVRTADAARQ